MQAMRHWRGWKGGLYPATSTRECHRAFVWLEIICTQWLGQLHSVWVSVCGQKQQGCVAHKKKATMLCGVRACMFSE